MILYTLDELKAKRDRIQKEIDNYDQKAMWSKCLDNMSIRTYDFIDDSDGLEIAINNGYILYSWELPKGSFVIRNSGNDLRISVRRGSIDENRSITR